MPSIRHALYSIPHRYSIFPGQILSPIMSTQGTLRRVMLAGVSWKVRPRRALAWMSRIDWQ